MMHPEDPYECDYCRGRGKYQIDGKTFPCFCQDNGPPSLPLSHIIKAKKARRWREHLWQLAWLKHDAVWLPTTKLID